VGEGEKNKILIAKLEGDIYALGAYCSHLGVPLAMGATFGDKVVCPAHGAAFSITTGD